MGTPANTRHYAGGLLLFLSSAAAIHMTLLSLLPCHAKPDDSSCIPSEREALLRFKRDLTDPSNRLSSWAEEDSHADCCHWSGVVCDNSTGHVLQLRLACTPPPSSNSYWCDAKVVLGGKLSPSLLNLKHLAHLDLSFNDFGGVPIPTFLGSLENLRYLNLSHGEFGGTIPHQLGNLSRLQSLDFNYEIGLCSSSLEWASGLSSLKFLGLSWVDLSRAHDWPHISSRLPSLQQLHLSNCLLPYINIPTSVPAAVNFSSLSVLYLSGNSLSLVPGWVFTLPALTSLSLSLNNLQGPIPVGLRNLTGLTVLRLYYNRFNSSLPEWLFDLNKLEYLDLAVNCLQGRILEAIGNMTSLTSLDLSHNQLNSSLPKRLFDLNKLEDLDLGGNSLQGRIPEAIGNMTSLATLDLSGNMELQGGGSLLKSLGNLCRLTKVDLSPIKFGFMKDVRSLTGCILHGLVELSMAGSQLSGQFSDLVDHFGQFKNLARLHLSNNSLAGPIPESIGRLSTLEILDLSHNQLIGPIPESIGTLLSLQELYIHHNQLNGSLPQSLGQLINLEWLDTSYNPLTGDVSEIHFANLTKLFSLKALGNKFSLKVRPNWIPAFRVDVLLVDSWKIGPQFPPWLRSQLLLSQLQMSRSEIRSTIPNWFWNSFPQLSYLNLSQNQIHGNLHESSIISLYESSNIDLSSNQFSSLPPLISPKLRLLSLSNNYFFGSISPFLCHESHDLKQLQYLNLQNNHLSGELPDCWTNWTNLIVLRLGNNKFTGNLPSTIGFLNKLQSFHFENNHLQGEIPTSLGNCKQLISINLGENNFVGSLPTWIGKQLSLLKLLRLHSNKFDGNIPYQMCALTSLQVLDLAYNNLHGSIPICFNKFIAMSTLRKNASIPIVVFSGGNVPQNVPEDVLLVWKRITFEYKQTLGLMTSMDLSSNNLSGEIPRSLMTLIGMRSLNLSNNFLTGEIPEAIGDMKFLESIDLSHNQISGEIPLRMSTLTFLCFLDLSKNKLVGRIPSSTQLQSFEPSSYVGNKLCGPPLPNNCSTMIEAKSEQAKEEDKMDVYMIYGSMTIGFIVGFWIIWGLLLFMKSWRLAYFKSLESLYQKIHVVCNTCS